MFVTHKEIKYFWVENQSDRNPMSFREIITLGLHFDCKKWYAGVTEKVPGGDQPKFPYRRAAPLLEKNPDLPDLCLIQIIGLICSSEAQLWGIH